jgi:photosystem II stability/assembly factor-like uncharacterized protein
MAQVAKPAGGKPAKAPVAASKRDERRPADHLMYSVSGIKAHIANVKAKAREKAEAALKQQGKTKELDDEDIPAGEKWESYLYRLRLRAYPYDSLDMQAQKRAVEHRSKMPISPLAKQISPAPKAPAPKAPAGLTGERVDKMSATGIVGSGARWEFNGPRRLGIPYEVYYGPEGTFLSGRVNAVAYDPTRIGRAYLTGAQGGVWRTTDNGRNWTPLGDTWPTLFATAVAVNPDTGRVFVGTGDFNGSQGAGASQGIMRSDDAGNTWTIVGDIMDGECVSEIRIHPDDPNIVLATTGRGTTPGGVFRSLDGGDTWAEVTPTGMQGDWSGLAISEFNGSGRSVYACRIGQGVFRSDDQGETWVRLNVPLAFNNPASPAGGLGLRIAASRVVPDGLYVMDASDGSQDGRIFYSSNRGASWLDISGNFPNTISGTINNFSQASYDLYIATARTVIGGVPTDIVYGGAIAIAATVGGQGFWSDISFTLTPNAKTHNDQHYFAENPLIANSGFFGNDGGIYGVNFNPLSQSWFIDGQLNATLGVTQFYHADWSNSNPNLMIGGTQDNATPRTNGTTLATWGNVGGGDGGGCAINVVNNNIQYTTSQNGPIYRTTNNWVGSGVISPDWRNGNQVAQTSNPPFVGVVEVNQAPNAAGILYYGTQYLWRWSETAGNWLVDTSMPPKVKPMGGTQLTNDANAFITAIAAAPGPLRNADGSTYQFQVGNAIKSASAGNVVFVGTSDGQLWVTLNALDTDVDADTRITWTRLNTASLPNRAITSISIDPSNAGDILVGLSGTGTGHVYRLANILSPNRVFTNQSGFGASSLPDIPLNDITRDPTDAANTFYVATDIGVFQTTDAGSTWANATQPLGLPNVECTEIKASDRVPRGTGYLNVATFGRGMWRIALPAPQAPDIQFSTSVSQSTFGPTPSYRFTLNVVNKGGPATAVQITSATLATDRGQAIPRLSGAAVTIGDMPPGAVRVATYHFTRGGVASVGTGVVLTINYTRGGVAQPPVKLRTRLP